jgi:uncharacterized repeat protein (TIGR03803 family)
VLHSFDGGDGAWSRGSLVREGRVLYGRTAIGGTENSGTIFRIDEDGSAFAVLDSFTAGGGNGAGNQPHHNAMLLAEGVLLGAALYGKNENNAPGATSAKTIPPLTVQQGKGTERCSPSTRAAPDTPPSPSSTVESRARPCRTARRCGLRTERSTA